MLYYHSIDVYGAENCITIVETPGVNSDSDQETDFSRLLGNTLNEAVRWMIQKMVITQEDTEAKREKLKVHYPQVKIMSKD